MRSYGNCFSIMLVAVLAFSVAGCNKSESVLHSYNPQNKKVSEARAVTAQDGLRCMFLANELSVTTVGDRNVGDGTLRGFQCENPSGTYTGVELASDKLSWGLIATKRFGTIRTEIIPGGIRLYMTEDQITRLKEYLSSGK